LPVSFEAGFDSNNVAVSIKIVEECHLLLDGSVCEVSATSFPVGFGERLRAVALLHGVDEAGLFVVAKIRQGGNIHSSHHLVVFVDQVVAVEHVQTIPGCVASNHIDLLVGVQPNHVLLQVSLAIISCCILWYRTFKASFSYGLTPREPVLETIWKSTR